MAFDIYEAVTARIIEQLEQGIIPWKKPWAGMRDGAISYSTGKPYSLLNQIMLMKTGEYATFKQIEAAGGKVKKGAKAKMVVFWKLYRKEQTDASGAVVCGDDGKPLEKVVPVLRYYNVFHVEDDCENIAPKWTKAAPCVVEPIETAEKVAADYLDREHLPLFHEKGNSAYYSPSRDEIHLPLVEQFLETAEYYSTAFHEMVHSTGHAKRLNRFTGAAASASFGSEEYSKEELVAEIGAAAILHRIGIETPSSFKNSAAYIQSWLKALRDDKKMIVGAAGRADKAAAYILGENVEQEAAAE